jgi:superfamily II DNA or RNA helicase
MNVIAEHLRAHEPSVVVWLANSQELCEQAASEFEKCWMPLGNRPVTVYRFWENFEINVDDISDGVVVAGFAKMYQSTMRDISFITRLGRKCSLVVIDEAHMAVADTYKLTIETLVAQQPSTAMLGLTATPGRSWLDVDADKMLAKFFSYQKVTLRISGYDNPIDYLVSNGYLAKAEFRQLLHNNGSDLSQSDLRAIQQGLEIPASILEKLARDDLRNLRIISEVESLAQKHSRVLVFAATVEHSQLLAAVLKARGLNARSITSQSSSSERLSAINQYKQKTEEVRILCNYGVLTTGFDAPQTSAAVIARPTKSLVLYSQMIGRAVRGPKAGGNLTAEIVTVIDRSLPGFRSISESFTFWEDIWE